MGGSALLKQLQQAQAAEDAAEATNKSGLLLNSIKVLDLDAALAIFKRLSADGLPTYTAQVKWFDDPFGSGMSNEVCSTIKVEVVRADLL